MLSPSELMGVVEIGKWLDTPIKGLPLKGDSIELCQREIEIERERERVTDLSLIHSVTVHPSNKLLNEKARSYLGGGASKQAMHWLASQSSSNQRRELAPQMRPL